MEQEWRVSAMAKEIEAKILDIDSVKIRQMLISHGAKKVAKLTKQSRYVFDIDKNDKSKWIRLRTDGRRTTLTVKIIKSNDIDGTIEYETEVSDIDSTLKILESLGFKPKSYQENYRELYELDTASISIDYWPRIKPYLEVEAESAELVEAMLKKFNPEGKEVTSENTKFIYERAGIDLDKIERLTFSSSDDISIRAQAA